MRFGRVLVIFVILVTGIWYYQLTESYGIQNLSVSVERVIDGDTFVSDTGEKFRLKGINTPEEGMAQYEEAKEYLKELIEGREVQVEIDSVDKYGRFLAHVFIEGEHVNKEILRKGFGTLYYYEEDNYFEDLASVEELAWENELGIWKKSSNEECLELIELKYEEEGGRCIEGELLRIRNSCEYKIEVTFKDDATHIYKETLEGNMEFEKSFSCIFNDAGDSLYVWDAQGLLIFERY